MVEYDCWRDSYFEEFQRCSNIKVIDNDDISIYEYFTLCKYQIGVSSFAIIEGLRFGLMTFILKGFLCTEMEDFIVAGNMFLVSEASEIADKILNGQVLPPMASGDDLICRNSVKNLEKAFEEIFKQLDG